MALGAAVAREAALGSVKLRERQRVENTVSRGIGCPRCASCLCSVATEHDTVISGRWEKGEAVVSAEL